ncbi:GNAT family N-acetyltransferase [Myxococcota bacterium]|nr:GNAT family N-acetyltransferase [Myxococcota bacterium]
MLCGISGDMELKNTLKLRILKNAKAEELAEIGEISQEAFLRFGDYRDFISDLASDEDGVFTAMLIDVDRIAGFILVGFMNTKTGGLIADILAIALKPDYRYMGLGEELMSWAMDLVNTIHKTRNILYARLTVAPDNEPAVKLFRKFGFEFDGSDIGVYSTGVPAAYMKKLFLP